MPPSEHVVVALVYGDIQGLDLVGPLDVFAGATTGLAELRPLRARYRTIVASVDGAPVVTESHLSVNTVAVDTVLAEHDRIGTLLIPGGLGAHRSIDDDALLDATRRLAASAERVVTVCTGAFVAAAAGLADGKRVTTHWARAESLQRRFPAVTVDAEPIYLCDDGLWSSAGVTAGIDLALALVEDDHGAEVAQLVARWLVMFLRRPGGQTQFAAPVWTDRADTGPIRTAQDLIDLDPGADHRVPLLAERVGMSERHFTRRFTDEVGASPAQYVASVRVEAARRELESTTRTVDVIARRCGFGTAETMRRTFARRLGVSPDEYRRRFRTAPMTSTDRQPERTH